jgi:hypothetical protein
MTGAQQSHRTAQAPAAYDRGAAPPTGWIGWVYFAGVMMIMLGAFQAIAGLVALFNDTYYLVAKSGLVVSADYTTWGWVHILLGVVALLAGFAVMAGRVWGRTIGIIMAVVSAIANMAFVPAYPVWAILIIAVDVIVIYALAVHGGEARD